MTRLGSILIRWTTVRNASSQNFKGIDAPARRARPTSTICLCLRSAEPFCWCAWGHETWCEMPSSWKNKLSFLCSPSQSVCRKTKLVRLEKISLLSYTAWTRGSRAHKSVVKEYCGTTLFTHKELKKYQIRISYRLTMLHFIHQVSVSNFIGVLREKFNSVPTGWGSIFSFSSTKDSMYGLMHPYSTKDHQQW